MKGYVWEIDENGDDVLTLPDGADFPLPRGYRSREVAIAARNIAAGHERADLAISRNVLHLAVQRYREHREPPWGSR